MLLWLYALLPVLLPVVDPPGPGPHGPGPHGPDDGHGVPPPTPR